MLKALIIYLVLNSLNVGKAYSPPKYSSCNKKDFGHGSFVCVCNENGCDQFEETGSSPLKPGQFAQYTSSKAGERFSLEIGTFNKSLAFDSDNSEMTLTVNTSVTYQSILGFGGAFTDAATMNILNISSNLQEKLLQSYYSKAGIEYNIGRIPMASCDFSTREYSYDDVSGDFSLSNFSLAEEDLKFKIPVMETAIKMSGEQEILFFGSPWSAPAWMKTNGKMTGFGQLKGKAGDNYHKTWAMYFAKFIKAYEDKGIKLWGVTVQNEPSDGFIPGFSFQCMGLLPGQERDFIKYDLGPTLSQEGYKDVKVMMLDDQRIFLNYWSKAILSDPDAAKYVSGIALHWYWDWLTPAADLTKAHEMFPDHFMLATEACVDSSILSSDKLSKKGAVVLGDWSRGEKYSHSIIEDLSHWVVGWVDWNLALNMIGGPNWVKNFVDSPVIVDAENKAFYKQPMYYHLGHFAKFVHRGSKRIAIESSAKTSLEFIAFITPDSTRVVVLLNKSDKPVAVDIIDPEQGRIATTIPASSIQTHLWDKPAAL